MMKPKKLTQFRWNWIIAAACLVLLAWFRTVDGHLVPAVLLGVAAAGAALVAVTTSPPTGRRDAATHTHGKEARPHPSPSQVERTLTWYRARSRVWLVTVILGWAAAILGVVIFPPLAVVAAAAAAYAVVRYRRVRAYARTLALVLPKLSDEHSASADVESPHIASRPS